MNNHPNRNANSAAATPKPAQIRAARLAADLTPGQAGALIHERANRWQKFESGEVALHPALWDQWQYKVAQRAVGQWREGPGAQLAEAWRESMDVDDVVEWADGIRGALGTEYADRVTDREAIIADAIHRAATTPAPTTKAKA